jgi:hypothetical protein
MFSFTRSGVVRAYIFSVGSLVFGLPLAISYYAIQNDTSLSILFVLAYTAVTILGSVTLLFFGGDLVGPPLERPGFRGTPESAGRGSYKSAYLALTFTTFACISFVMMKYYLFLSYPAPSASANAAGGAYILFLSLSAATGFPFLIRRGIPIVSKALSDPRYMRLAAGIALLYFVTYELLVNEIIITGYNTPPGNYVPSPTGLYPWAYIFTSGPSPSSLFESFIYVPYVLVQLNDTFNFIFQPFEILLAIMLSTLMGVGIVVTLFSMKRSPSIGAACRSSAALSGLGGFLGYTATCPSCLAPTLVSALFGGVSIVQAAYANIYGATIPPLISLAAMLVSLLILNRTVKYNIPEWNAGQGSILQTNHG